MESNSFNLQSSLDSLKLKCDLKKLSELSESVQNEVLKEAGINSLNERVDLLHALKNNLHNRYDFSSTNLLSDNCRNLNENDDSNAKISIENSEFASLYQTIATSSRKLKEARANKVEQKVLDEGINEVYKVLEKNHDSAQNVAAVRSPLSKLFTIWRKYVSPYDLLIYLADHRRTFKLSLIYSLSGTALKSYVLGLCEVWIIFSALLLGLVLQIWSMAPVKSARCYERDLNSANNTNHESFSRNIIDQNSCARYAIFNYYPLVSVYELLSILVVYGYTAGPLLCNAVFFVLASAIPTNNFNLFMLSCLHIVQTGELMLCVSSALWFVQMTFLLYLRCGVEALIAVLALTVVFAGILIFNVSTSTQIVTRGGLLSENKRNRGNKRVDIFPTQNLVNSVLDLTIQNTHMKSVIETYATLKHRGLKLQDKSEDFNNFHCESGDDSAEVGAKAGGSLLLRGFKRQAMSAGAT